jgi:hypothetical protein
MRGKAFQPTIFQETPIQEPLLMAQPEMQEGLEKGYLLMGVMIEFMFLQRVR